MKIISEAATKRGLLQEALPSGSQINRLAPDKSSLSAGGSWPAPPEDSRDPAAQPFPGGASRFEAFATERFETVGQASPGETTEKGRPRGPATAYFLGSWLDLTLTRWLCRLTGRRPWRNSGFPPRLWLGRVLSKR